MGLWSQRGFASARRPQEVETPKVDRRSATERPILADYLAGEPWQEEPRSMEKKVRTGRRAAGPADEEEPERARLELRDRRLVATALEPGKALPAGPAPGKPERPLVSPVGLQRRPLPALHLRLERSPDEESQPTEALGAGDANSEEEQMPPASSSGLSPRTQRLRASEPRLQLPLPLRQKLCRLLLRDFKASGEAAPLSPKEVQELLSTAEVSQLLLRLLGPEKASPWHVEAVTRLFLERKLSLGRVRSLTAETKPSEDPE